MFLVEFHNLRPNEEVDHDLEAHRAFLADCVERGHLVAAGPKVPRTGGIMVAANITRETLDRMLAEDPFLKSGSARCVVTEFRSNFFAPSLERLLMPDWAQGKTDVDIYGKLSEMGVALPHRVDGPAAYVPCVRIGNLVFASGHLARRDGAIHVGQLGADIGVAEARNAARDIAIDLLVTLEKTLGDLRKLKRIVKVMGLVNSTPTFTEHHLVVNGCSELLNEIFATAGGHARSAFGVAQLPMGACVEIELVAEVAD